MSDGKRYTVGIVGCGRVAALHAEAYTLVPGTQLVAAADIDADKLDLFCERWSIPQRYVYESQRRGLARVDFPLEIRDNPFGDMLDRGQI
jgi:predicted dehydrogenase